MLRFDFSYRVPTCEDDPDHPLNYIAGCLNTLNEDYERTAISVNMMDLLIDAPAESIGIVSNQYGRIRLVSSNAEKIFNIKAHMVSGKNLKDILKNYNTIYKKFKDERSIRNFSTQLLSLDKMRKSINVLVDIHEIKNMWGDIEGSILYILKRI